MKRGVTSPPGCSDSEFIAWLEQLPSSVIVHRTDRQRAYVLALGREYTCGKQRRGWCGFAFLPKELARRAGQRIAARVAAALEGAPSVSEIIRVHELMHHMHRQWMTKLS